MTWVPGAGAAAGELILSGQSLVGSGGAVDTAPSGRVPMVKRSAGTGRAWQIVASPIGLGSTPADPDWCRNYSSPLLPVTGGGSRMLMLQTDRSADGGCQTRFGVGSLQ